MKQPRSQLLLAALVLAFAATGCGIKGPLTLPEKSEKVVIRAPAGASPQAPATQEKTVKPAPSYERLPPPPLPSSNPGSSPGG